MKPILGYDELYAVTEEGRVYSNITRKYLKPLLLKTGYLQVKLTKNKKHKSLMVHRLVAEAFLGKGGNLQVNHLNGIKTDNHFKNLEWCTAKQNTQHAINTGLNKEYGEGNGNSKLTSKQVSEIRNIKGKSFTEIGKIFGISRTQVTNIVKHFQWKSV